MRGADRVRKARVVGAGVGERSEPHLPYPAQALHLARFEQRRDDRLLGGFEGNQPVNGVAQDHWEGPSLDRVQHEYGGAPEMSRASPRQVRSKKLNA